MGSTVVDLFCGAGGASLGLEATRFDIRVAVDEDETACQIYTDNLSVEAQQADLTEVNVSEICLGQGIDTDEIEVVVGCPPCQNFSSLRRTTPWPEGEPKDELLVTFVDQILEASPEIVIFENVKGILQSDGGRYIDWFKYWMRKAGYGIALDVVDAADFGVPQHRERTMGFCVHGARSSELSFPEPTHAAPEEAEKNGKKWWRTVRDAIQDLPELEAGEDSSMNGHSARNHQESTLELIDAVPNDGGSRTDIPSDLELDCHQRLERSSQATNVYGRMKWDEPAPTLTTRCTVPSCGRFIHPEQNRAITHREAARLMSFPDGFELPSKRKDADRLVGNALPPTMMKNLVSQFFNANEDLL